MTLCTRLLALLLPFGLAACGFQPVYGPSLTSSQSALQIEEIPGRAGHELREALVLESRNGVPGAPANTGLMVVRLEERVLNTGFRSDGSTFRATMRLTADYVVDFGESGVSGQQTAEISYDVPDAPFADISTQNDATQRVAQDLARRIMNDLTLQLARDS